MSPLQMPNMDLSPTALGIAGAAVLLAFVIAGWLEWSRRRGLTKEQIATEADSWDREFGPW